MAKLVYSTHSSRVAHKGGAAQQFVAERYFHESRQRSDKIPLTAVQDEAGHIVKEAMRKLAQELEALGYDKRTIRFTIDTLSI